VVSSTPLPHFTPEKDPVPILQEAGWAPRPVWMGGKSRPHRDSIQDRPSRSSVVIQTELTGPQRYMYIYIYVCVCVCVDSPVNLCMIKHFVSMKRRIVFIKIIMSAVH